MLHTISLAASTGGIAHNLLGNTSFESGLTGWAGTMAALGGGLYGAGALQITAELDALRYAHQSVSLAAGTYALSAYVKTQSLEGEGAWLEAVSGSTVVGRSGKVNQSTPDEIQHGWQRLTMVFHLSAPASIQVRLAVKGSNGYARFDNVQLERGEGESQYNLLENSTFGSAQGWSITNGAVVSGYGVTDTQALRLNGDPGHQAYASRTVAVDQPVHTTFIVSGWARAESVRLYGDAARTFGMAVILTYTDGITEEHTMSFNPESTAWQFASMGIAPRRAVEIASVSVRCLYEYNANTAYFDHVSLIIDAAQTYEYDENGKLVQRNAADGSKSSMVYAANGVDLTESNLANGASYT